MPHPSGRYDDVPDQSVVGHLKKLVRTPNWLTQLSAKYGSDKGALAGAVNRSPLQNHRSAERSHAICAIML
jgi:hypothetical protein